MHDMTMQTEALTEEHAATLAYIHAVDDPEVPDERFKLWTPQELLDSNAPPVWTIKGLVIRHTYGMLAGPEKSLKSYFAQFVAVGAAAGVPVLGQFEVPEAVPVLMFVGEGGRLPYTRRLKRIAAAYGVSLGDLPLLTSFDVASVLSDAFRHSFVQHLKDYQPSITIIEPYYAFHGTASEGKMLHQEGDQLVWLSHTAEEFGSSLIIGNHYNQTGAGHGLRRITGAGPAEWSDSWWIVEKDEDKSDVTTGHFELALEVGSRQWGATAWDLTVDIGLFDDDTMDNEGDITWTVQRLVTITDFSPDSITEIPHP
jgi:RecA-family ATPase